MKEIIKKVKIFFLLSGAFSLFLVISFPEKMIRKCFEVKEE